MLTVPRRLLLVSDARFHLAFAVGIAHSARERDHAVVREHVAVERIECELVDLRREHALLEIVEDDDADRVTQPPEGQLVELRPRLVNIVFDILLRRPSDSVVFFDEPELHLHPELSHKLLNTLGTVGERNQFVLSTHSPDIITAALDQSVTEPYRVSRRPLLLRGWGLWDDQVGSHRRFGSERSRSSTSSRSAPVAVRRHAVGGREAGRNVETLRKWVRQAERDAGRRLTTTERVPGSSLDGVCSLLGSSPERGVRRGERAADIVRRHMIWDTRS